MAGRTRAVRNTPINSVNSINSVDSQQPQCEDADMEGTPIHMPQQELSPPYTRDSTHRHDPETHGNDIRMPDTTFTPMFQIPDPAYGMPDSTFSAGLLDPDALPKLMKLLTELKNSFFLNCASETYVSVKPPQLTTTVDADMLTVPHGKLARHRGRKELAALLLGHILPI